MFRPAWIALLLFLFSSAAFSQKPARVHTDGLQPGAANARFIVKYKPGARVGDAFQAAERLALVLPVPISPRGIPAAPRHSVERQLSTGAFIVRTHAAMHPGDAVKWMDSVAADSAVEYVEVDLLFDYAVIQVNDPWYNRQPHLWGPNGIRADLAWSMTQGDGVVVGVVDSGVIPHPDLDAALLPGRDFIENDGDPSVPECDKSTHGTRTAGTIAAITNNNRGVASVAPKVRIVPVRSMPGCTGKGHLSDIAHGIDWASGGTVPGVPANANPAEVVNVSLGAEAACSHTMQAAIDAAVARGTTVVVAAGNDGFDAGRESPANCANVVTVGGVDEHGARNDFSNWGSVVDIAAPGQIVWPNLDDQTGVFSTGTSYAAPMVAGVVALMQAAAPKPLPPARIEALLRASAAKFPAPVDRPLGAGIANGPAAVSLAQSEGAPRILGSYVIVVRGLLPGMTTNGCLAANTNGSEAPGYFREERTGPDEHCGLGSEAAVVQNQQTVWDVGIATDDAGVTAHFLRNRLTGKCLIRGQNGKATRATLYHWGAGNGPCGFPDIKSFIANGQAAWFLDTPIAQPKAGKTVTTAGLKLVRPGFAFLGFDAQTTSLTDVREWEFEFHPVAPSVTSPVTEGVPFVAVNEANGKCMAIVGQVTIGSRLVTAPCNGSSGQVFVMLAGMLHIQGRCLDIEASYRLRSTPVLAYICHGEQNQRWTIEPMGRIRSLMSGGTQFCLDLHTEDNDSLKTWDCHLTTNHQRFTFRAP